MQQFLAFIASISVLFLTACAQLTVTSKTQSGSIPNTTDIHQEVIKRGDVDTVARVISYAGQNSGQSQTLVATRLQSSTKGNVPNFNERYVYQGFASDGPGLTGGVSDDSSFVPNRLGVVGFLSIRQFNESAESIPINGAAHLGAAWLARVEDNDRTVPWVINSGTSCFPIGNNDCFDMSSLSRLLFDNIVSSVNSGINSSIPIGVLGVDHRLRYIPNVARSNLGPADRVARGFGFIYQATVRVPGVTYNVYVPMEILFTSNIDEYLLVVDPLQVDADDQLSIGRVYVKEEILGIGTSIGSTMVRDSVIDSIQTASLPSFVAGIDFSTGLLTAINGAAGNTPSIPDNHNVILVPTGQNRNLSSNILWQQLSGGPITNPNQVNLFFLE